MGQPLDLLLVKPSDRKKVYGSLGSTLSAIEPPVWALLLAAYARSKGFSVSVLDMEAENISVEELPSKIASLSPRLVILTVTGNNLSASTWNMVGAGKALAALAATAPAYRTCLWGLHPSSLPERTLDEENVDYVIQGEGFSALEELLKGNDPEGIRGLWYRKEGKPLYAGPSPLAEKLDELPYPAWDLLDLKRYRAHNWHCFHDLEHRSPYAVIYTSLGCPNACSFCSLKTLFGRRGVRFRSPENVIGEIDLLVKEHGVKNIKILDECFILNEAHVSRLADLIIERGYDLNMWAYARIDTVNEPLLKKLRKAGLNWVCYGIESGNKKILENVDKRGWDADRIRAVVKMTKDAGINILANFMLGLPEDDMDSMRDTLELARELNCEYTNFYCTMAYPGSDLYNEALRDGIRLPDTWLGYSQFSAEALPLPTKHLKAEEVLRFRDYAFEEFHRSPAYLEMIRKKFGPEAEAHIKDMLSHKIVRKHAKPAATEEYDRKP